MALKWQWLRFEELDQKLLYKIMAVRQAVFIVEQGCIYQDLDGLDLASYHLIGVADDGDVVAYLRVIFPGNKYANEPAIGRVLTVKAERRKGYGRELIKVALDNIESIFGKSSVRLSAQKYLEKFYQDFGFETVSMPYDEDGIPHIEMLLRK